MRSLFEEDYAELEKRVLVLITDPDAAPMIAEEFEQFRQRFCHSKRMTVSEGFPKDYSKGYSRSYPYLSLSRSIGASYREVLIAADVLERADASTTFGQLEQETGIRCELLELVFERMGWEMDRRNREAGLPRSAKERL